ncbi:polyprenyl synthetase family protein, partial [Alterinioella nitratireducens]|uniref:polyprenyl synthetase family protein n=1 Tax=Alterinioella nitratireducens TaxID=2735915 RepID=UPI0040591ADC
MDVQHEDLYILARQERRGKGNQGRVRAAHKLFHGKADRRNGPACREKDERDMSLADAATRPHDRLRDYLAEDMEAVNALIRTRMASEHAPRIPEVTAHLVEAGGKRIRPMMTLAAARICGYAGEDHRKLAATVEFIHTATLLHDDVVDESGQRRGRPTANLL